VFAYGIANPIAAGFDLSHVTAAVTVDPASSDYDPAGTTLTVTSVGTPLHGTTVINGNGTVTYTPTSGTTAATDSFTYTISDAAGGTATGTVNVGLANRAPAAAPVNSATNGTSVTIVVLDSVSDSDGDAQTVTTVGTPAHGTAVINTDQTVTYTPTGGTTATSDTFTYTVTDGYGGTSTSTVTVALGEQAPTAADDTACQVSTAVTLDVLANDFSPVGETLSATAASTPAHGTATINGDNTITYTPATGTTAPLDRFTYTISDGHGGTATATVSVFLANRPPIAQDIAASTHSSAVTVVVLARASDPDQDALTVSSVGTPAHGTAVINGDNTVTYTPTSGTTVATDQFTYAVSDGFGGTSTATVVVYLKDRAPIVVNAYGSPHGNPVTLNVLANAYDPDWDTMTVTAVGSPAHGTASINGDNTVTYTPTSGVTAATDSFTYTISDGQGGSSIATVVVYLSDRSPEAFDTSASPHGSAATINVLGNDFDPDGDTLTVSAVGTPGHGTASINGDNTVTYTPTAGTTAATDSFTYTISDGHGGTSTATVILYLSDRPPLAVGTSASPHGSAVTINVLANDSDPDGDTLTVTAAGTPGHGTATINADNTITYTPIAGTTAATDSFTYTISDGHGGTSSATVVLYLTDRPPVAANISASPHGNPVTISVLASDSDPDGDALTVTSVGTPGHGTAVINADNTVTYTPTAGTTAATDSFTYNISDGNGGTSTATVVLYLTDRPPVALAASASPHGNPVTINVLGNDSDADGDKLTVTAIGTPGHGTAVVNADNTITFTPTAGTTAATDSFTYTIADGYGGSSTGTVYVYLADRAPTATNVGASPHSAAVTISVLAGDWDPDGDALTVTGVGTPGHGTAVVNADNTVTYTPTAGTTAATDSFTYTISDGNGKTSSATVSVYLADQAPVAMADSAPSHSTAVTLNVLANDSDPDGDKLTVTAVGTPAHGTAVINADSTITYTPSGGLGSTDTFTYTISDGQGGTSSATITIYLVDLMPTAGPVTATPHGSPVTLNVLAACSDPEGDSLTVQSVGTPAHGTAVANPDNTVTYTPNAGATTGTDSFTYYVSDGYTGYATGTVSIQLGDQAPAAVNDSGSPHGNAVTISVLANDSDPDGDPLTVTAAGTPAHGTAVVNADNTITYTPTAGTTYTTDSFTYTISDGYGGSSSATVSIYLTDRAPVAANEVAAMDGSTAITVGVLASCSDPDGDPLTVTAAGTPAHGTAVLNADNTVTYTPTAGTTATTDTFTYTISDGYGGTSTATVTVYLVNPGTIANQVNATTISSTPVTINPLVNDYNPDGDSISVTAIGTPSAGTAVLNADGTVAYTPASPFWTGTATFTYTIADTWGGTATGTVYVTVDNPEPQKVIANDVYDTTYLNGAININLLANQYNDTSYALTVTAVGSGTNGSVTLNSDGTVTYTPSAGTTATSDTFTFTISDGHGDTSTATIHISLEH
jgi:serine/threonine protein phosphatase PrpC